MSSVSPHPVRVVIGGFGHDDVELEHPPAGAQDSRPGGAQHAPSRSGGCVATEPLATFPIRSASGPEKRCRIDGNSGAVSTR